MRIACNLQRALFFSLALWFCSLYDVYVALYFVQIQVNMKRVRVNFTFSNLKRILSLPYTHTHTRSLVFGACLRTPEITFHFPLCTYWLLPKRESATTQNRWNGYCVYGRHSRRCHVASHKMGCSIIVNCCYLFPLFHFHSFGPGNRISIRSYWATPLNSLISV